ncbi:MAG TPA: MFS transporter [Candidatus Baltobacteraceae bacterium]|jgi:DHA2 family methylenomycin A resistance protein-like MFS transporter
MRPALRTRLGGFGTYLAFFVALLNVSVMYLAVPKVVDTFGADLSLQQWFIGIYPLMQAGFMLAAGTIGDLFGRRRTLIGATAVFALASIASAIAPNLTFLILARAVEGLSSAALLALPPAMLVALLPHGSDEGPTIKRIGVWGGIAGGLAPVIGGVIVNWFSWPGVFWMSALLAIAVLIFVGLDPIAEKRGTPKKFDVVGQVLSVAAFLLLSYALIDGDAQGWASLPILAAFAAGVGALWAFVAVEARIKQPMVHVAYFKHRKFNVSLAIIAVVNFAWYGLFLLCSVFLQEVRHEGPFWAGIFLLPCNVAFFVANLASVWFARRFGFAQAIAVSFLLTLVGITWLATLHASSHGWQVGAGLALAGLGWGLVVTPGTALGMEAVPAKDEGFASATQALVRALFGVFGVALLGSIPGNSVEVVAFMRGWPVAMLVAGGLTAAFAIGVVLAVRRRDADLPVLERGSA